MNEVLITMMEGTMRENLRQSYAEGWIEGVDCDALSRRRWRFIMDVINGGLIVAGRGVAAASFCYDCCHEK